MRKSKILNAQAFPWGVACVTATKLFFIGVAGAPNRSYGRNRLAPIPARLPGRPVSGALTAHRSLTIPLASLWPSKS